MVLHNLKLKNMEHSQELQHSEQFLNVQNLKLDFQIYQGLVKVLDGISFKMMKGEILGLVGETGCGKTVTSRSLIKLLEQNAVLGEESKVFFKGSSNLIDWNEEELRTIRGNNISVIFQEPMTHLNPTMRNGDQIGESLILHFRKEMTEKAIDILNEEKPSLKGLYENLLKSDLENPESFIIRIAGRLPITGRYKKYVTKASRKEAIKILESVNMPSPERIAMAYPHELSGGMRQRVLIGIAIACDPDLIIADEPTTAVDVTTQAQILRLLLSYKRDHDTSILLITHNLGLVAELCDRVCVMYAGQIAEIGKVEDIFNRPMHPYTRGLMRAIPKIGENRKIQEIEGNVPILLHPPSGCRFNPRCSYVMPICSKQKPTLQEPKELPDFIEIDETISKDHRIHCWLYQKKEE
ncbi:ABC transporter ATP-binding protein [Thermoproteota archaeon]